MEVPHVNSAERQLVDYLGEVRVRAGAPSARSIARSMGSVSHTTINEILNGSRLSRWGPISRLGEFLGADLEKLLGLWRATQSSSGDTPAFAVSNDNFDPTFDPFIYNDVVVTVKYRGRAVASRVTERRVTAVLPGVDRYTVRTSTSSEPNSAPSIDIVDTINCEIGEKAISEVSAGNWLLTAELLLPAPLSIGESCFFANTVLFSESREAHPRGYAGFTVMGQRADRVQLRVQFDSNALPRKCWVFPGGPELDIWKEPETESGRIVSPSRFGYIDYQFRDLARANTVAIAWKWS